jgi:hypothetical protein
MSSNDKKKLEKKYQQLMEESYRLSHTNRKSSDLKRGEAEQVAVQLDAIEKEHDRTGP